MAALARNTCDTTRYDSRTRNTQHLTVVENTMAVLFPRLPVVGYAATVLKGMNKAILVDDVGVKSVALKASFDPAGHEGGAVFSCSRGFCRGVRSWGCTCSDDKGNKEQPNAVLTSMIRVVRATGGLGIPGLYVPSDPGAPDDHSAKGMLLVPFGALFEKGLSLATGQCNVKKYNRYLRDLIISGRAKPSFVVSHECGLDDAPAAYDKLDKRVEGYTKVLLHPNGGF